MTVLKLWSRHKLVAPVRERGLKYGIRFEKRLWAAVAPVRERGLKFLAFAIQQRNYKVAPVRERGLKYILFAVLCFFGVGRSREGAWIEIEAV